MSTERNVFDVDFFRGTVTRPHLWQGKGIVVLRTTKRNEGLYRLFRDRNPNFEGIEMPSEICFNDDDIRLPQGERQFLISGYKVMFKLEAFAPGILRAVQILPELNSRYKATIRYFPERQNDSYFGMQAILWQLNLDVVVSPESFDKFRGQPEFDYVEKKLITTGLINLSWNEAVLAQTEKRMPIGDVVKFYNVPGPDRGLRTVVDVHSNREATSSEEDDDEELEDATVAGGHSRAGVRESRPDVLHAGAMQGPKSPLDIKPTYFPPIGRSCCSLDDGRRSSTTSSYTGSGQHGARTRQRRTARSCCARDETSTDDDDDVGAGYDGSRNIMNEATYTQVWHRVNCSCCPANRDDVQQYQHGAAEARRPRSVSRPRPAVRHRPTHASCRDACCDGGERERLARQTSERRRSHSVGMPDEATHCDSRQRNAAHICCGPAVLSEMVMPMCGLPRTMPPDATPITATTTGAVCYNGAFYTPWQCQRQFYGLVSGLPACGAPSGTFVLQKPVSIYPNGGGADDAAAVYCCQMNENSHKTKRY